MSTTVSHPFMNSATISIEVYQPSEWFSRIMDEWGWELRREEEMQISKSNPLVCIISTQSPFTKFHPKYPFTVTQKNKTLAQTANGKGEIAQTTGWDGRSDITFGLLRGNISGNHFFFFFEFWRERESMIYVFRVCRSSKTRVQNWKFTSILLSLNNWKRVRQRTCVLR